MLSPVLVTPPDELAVSLDEAKAKLLYDDDDKDTLIQSLLDSAIAELDGFEGTLGRALVSQTWKLNLRCWPDCIRLPLAPVQSVSTVKYYDLNNAQQTFASASNWALYQDALSPYVGWLTTAVLPALYARADAIEVTFIAGYGAADAIPPAIRNAILLNVERHFGSLSPEEAQRSEEAEDRLLAKYRCRFAVMNRPMIMGGYSMMRCDRD
jgi:uncharacterized phiE125 gp8 family phage protein